MKNLTTVVFSKGRPMQLQAYLESLMHYTKIPIEQVIIVYHEGPGYDVLRSDDKFKNAAWIDDSLTGFDATLRATIYTLNNESYVLFGCDDVVYFRDVDIPSALNIMMQHGPRHSILGYSLRLGLNIANSDKIAHESIATKDQTLKKIRKESGSVWSTIDETIGLDTIQGVPQRFIGIGNDAYAYSMQSQHKIDTWMYPNDEVAKKEKVEKKPVPQNVKRHLMWNWVKNDWHWGYPFELMGSIYHSDLVKKIVSYKPNDPFRCPNDLEGRGDGILRYWEVSSYGVNLVMSHGPSACAAQDVNRVQDYAKNPIHGTPEHSAERLEKLFLEGKRIDWQKIKGIEPKDCFIGFQHFVLK